MKTDDELLKILKDLDELPCKDVKENLDNVYLKFDEWQRLTNEDLGFFKTYGSSADAAKGYMQIFKNEKKISYSKYLEVQHLPVTREWAKQPNRAKSAKEQNKSPDEVRTAEQIEKLWNRVRTKYDPLKEIERVSKDVANRLSYCSLENIDDAIDNVSSSLNNLHLAMDSVMDLYEKNEYSDLDIKIEKAVNQANLRLEKLKNSKDLPLDKIIEELGIDPEIVTKHFTDRMKVAEEGKSDRPSIMAREGRAFRLNNNGELEVIDEEKAKNETVCFFFPETSSDIINTLKEGTNYSKLAETLPKRTTLSPRKIERTAQEEEIKDVDANIHQGDNSEQIPSELSEKTIEELQRESEINDDIIAKNEEELKKQQIILKILSQQKIIREQKEEIARLQKEKERESEIKNG